MKSIKIIIAISIFSITSHQTKVRPTLQRDNFVAGYQVNFMTCYVQNKQHLTHRFITTYNRVMLHTVLINLAMVQQEKLIISHKSLLLKIIYYIKIHSKEGVQRIVTKFICMQNKLCLGHKKINISQQSTARFYISTFP